MKKRERLEATLAGGPTDRVPVALWQRWPGDDQRAADFVRSVMLAQERYDWDFVHLCPSDNFSVTGYGLQDHWEGALDGRRRVDKRLIQRSVDWTQLRPLDPTRGDLGRQLDSVALLDDDKARGEDPAPILHSILSPLAQAARLSGEATLIHHLRTQPDRLRSGLNTLTESTLRFMERLRRGPIDGIVYIVEHAHYEALSLSEYTEFGLPYDRKILESLPAKWWLNVVQLQGQHPMLNRVNAYPVQGLNWHVAEGETSLEAGKRLFKGALLGGLDAWQHLHHGTPTSIRDAAREALRQTDRRRFILTCHPTVPLSAPRSNLRAVREAVDLLR